jgi:hypothetical protein
MEVVERLRAFVENEARSCSMDFGCITPEYVYRMWGGSVSLEDIAVGLAELRKQGFSVL